LHDAASSGAEPLYKAAGYVEVIVCVICYCLAIVVVVVIIIIIIIIAHMRL
jgi:hypothetical protein